MMECLGVTLNTPQQKKEGKMNANSKKLVAAGAGGGYGGVQCAIPATSACFKSPIIKNKPSPKIEGGGACRIHVS